MPTITGKIWGADAILTVEKENREGWKMEADEAKCNPEIKKALRAFTENLPPTIKFIKRVGFPEYKKRSRLEAPTMDTFDGELSSVEIKLVYKE